MDAPLFVKKAGEDAAIDRLFRNGLRAKGFDEELIERAMARLQPVLLGLADVSLDVSRGDMAKAIQQLQANATVLAGHLSFAIAEAEGWKRIVKSHGNED